MRRKPGEPIYLGGQMLALVVAVLCAGAIPHAVHLWVAPMSFGVRFVASLVLSIAAGALLYRRFSAQAKNEPL